MTPEQFVYMVARMTKEGEKLDGRPFEWSNDDAYDTIHSLIGEARAIQKRLECEQKRSLLKEARVWLVACGSCGQYHRRGFTGDCREDAERFPVPYVPYPGYVPEDKVFDQNGCKTEIHP